MAAVSREFLATLKALSHPDYDRAESEATLLARLQSGLPNWTAAPADNLRRSLPLLADLIFLHGELENDNFHMGQMVNAENLYLDVFGVERNTPRLSGESDEDYLVRLANAGESQSIGTLPSIEKSVTEFNALVVDVQPVIRANRQDVDVYALKSGHTALTADENTALLAHLNDRRNKMAGVDLFLEAVTEAAFTIDVTVRHGSGVAAEALAADVRAGLYAWLAENQKIGGPVYRSAITAAAFVEDAVDVTAAEPSADLLATDGTVYTCASNMADVIVRTVAI